MPRPCIAQGKTQEVTKGTSPIEARHQILNIVFIHIELNHMSIMY